MQTLFMSKHKYSKIPTSSNKYFIKFFCYANKTVEIEFNLKERMDAVVLLVFHAIQYACEIIKNMLIKFKRITYRKSYLTFD